MVRRLPFISQFICEIKDLKNIFSCMGITLNAFHWLFVTAYKSGIFQTKVATLFSGK